LRAPSQTQDRVAVAEKRLSDVSGTVTETGQTLSQSDQQVKSELKELNFEIRKLWTLANNRNRNDIDSLTKQLVDHDASLKTLKVLGDNAVGQTKKHSDALNKTVLRLEKIESQLKDFSADMATSLLVSRETADKLTKAVNDLQRDTM
jgi:hypothetical protein